MTKNQVIPEAAVEAALLAYKHATFHLSTRNALIAALEASAPHMFREAQAEAWDHGEVTGYWKAKEDNPQNGPNPYRPTP